MLTVISENYKTLATEEENVVVHQICHREALAAAGINAARRIVRGGGDNFASQPIPTIEPPVSSINKHPQTRQICQTNLCFC